MKLVHWAGCYIWYSEEGTGRGRSPPRLLLKSFATWQYPFDVDSNFLSYLAPLSLAQFFPKRNQFTCRW